MYGLILIISICIFFFFNDTATTEIYTLSLHDALPICSTSVAPCSSGHGAAAARGRTPVVSWLGLRRGFVGRLDRPAIRIRVRGLENGFEFRHHVRIFLREVLLFAEVGVEVIKLQLRVRRGADAFPLAHARGLLESAFVKFPVKKLVPVRLRAAGERRKNRNAVVLRC